jgi:hypothetical protein
MTPGPIILASSVVLGGTILLTLDKLEDHRRAIEALRKDVKNNAIDIREIKGRGGRE